MRGQACGYGVMSCHVMSCHVIGLSETFVGACLCLPLPASACLCLPLTFTWQQVYRSTRVQHSRARKEGRKEGQQPGADRGAAAHPSVGWQQLYVCRRCGGTATGQGQWCSGVPGK